MSTDPSDVGRAFVQALSLKDREALASLIDPVVDFRGHYYDSMPEGRIARVSIVCSGFRPSESDTAG